MKKRLTLLLFAFGCFTWQGRTHAKPTLKFAKNGKFKIVPFTDLPRNPYSPHSPGTAAIIQKVLRIKKVALAILTGDVVTNRPGENGAYDRIKYDHIKWYRSQSKPYTATNGHQPLPTLAFFHIPLSQYRTLPRLDTTLGSYGERVSSASTTFALFRSRIDTGDVIGVFTGHDHNYIGITYAIALGFGRTTGADARGELERGGRVIELYYPTNAWGAFDSF